MSPDVGHPAALAIDRAPRAPKGANRCGRRNGRTQAPREIAEREEDTGNTERKEKKLREKTKQDLEERNSEKGQERRIQKGMKQEKQKKTWRIK